jgi:hypothetical protein
LKLYLGLTELSGTLILGVLDQFHETTFIRSKTSDFTDDALDKDSTLGSSLQIRNVCLGFFCYNYKMIVIDLG